MYGFNQKGPEYTDLYQEQKFIGEIVKSRVPEKFSSAIDKDLSDFSRRLISEVYPFMESAERNEPAHVPFAPWGERIDDIVMDEGWNELHKVAAREGMIAIGYERKSAEFSRLHQFLKIMLFHPISAYFTCPLAMTDGSARVIELSDLHLLKQEILPHLVSRDPDVFWTAGQWMTEKTGGSDVSNTETVATPQGDNYTLSGLKWFTSAITANITMTLAKIKGDDKLTMFFVRIRDKSGRLNNIEVLRLKDKLGTRAMPTAELLLRDCQAEMVGEQGEGVKGIATVLNISRIHNAACATGAYLRLYSLAVDFAKKRLAFNKLISEHPLHLETLKDQSIKVQACVHFVSEVSFLLGKSEVGAASAEEAKVLRLMTPVLKLWTGKMAVQGVSELLECFGGAGYMEDTGLPKYLRDTQVLSIWEGTTNILSLDTLRAIGKDNSFASLLEYIDGKLAAITDTELISEIPKIKGLLDEAKMWLTTNQSSREHLELGARRFGFALAEAFCGTLMLEFAETSNGEKNKTTALAFCDQLTSPRFNTDENHIEAAKRIVFS